MKRQFFYTAILSLVIATPLLTSQASGSEGLSSESSSSESSSSESASSESSSSESSCAAKDCKITTKEPESNGECPNGYTKYLFKIVTPGLPTISKNMCGRCIGGEDCTEDKECLMETYTEKQPGTDITITSARCGCKTPPPSSSSSSESSSDSSSSSFESSSDSSAS